MNIIRGVAYLRKYAIAVTELDNNVSRHCTNKRDNQIHLVSENNASLSNVFVEFCDLQ